MNPHRHLKFFFITLVTVALSCSIPPEIIDAINRLPTPTASPTPAPTANLYVEKTGDDSNDCLTAGTACLTIMAALGKAVDGAAIHVGPGTFAEIDSRSDGALVINKNVSLYGVAADGEYPTILSGNGTRDSVRVDGDSRVVLENFAIVEAGGRGIGLYVTGGAGQRVTLRNAVLRNNAAVAVRIPGSAGVEFENVRILNNPHGALTNSGQLTLRNTRIRNNGSLDRAWGWGTGVIYNDGTLRLADSTVAENSANDTHVIHNTGGGSMALERSTVSGHSVGRWSALYNSMDAAMTLINSTISGNSGSGITSLGDLTLSYTTIAGNALSGLYANSGPADPMHFRMENSIIENNGEQDCSYQLGHSIVFDLRGRNLSDGSCLFEYGGFFERPPEGDFFLADLADNGGPTQTRAILEYSLAIDNAEGPCPATDQRGIGRPVGGACDVGSYEFAFAQTAVTPADTPIPIWTPTPTGELPLLVTLLENANCRKGPDTNYDVETIVPKGDQVVATGRIQEPTWYQVETDKSKNLCWVSASLLEIPFDPARIPVASFPPLPDSPGAFQVVKSLCSANLNNFPVDLSWADPGGENGFRLYRNGELIATLGADVATYTDIAPKGTALNYELEAFNAAGRSPRATLSAPACQ